MPVPLLLPQSLRCRWLAAVHLPAAVAVDACSTVPAAVATAEHVDVAIAAVPLQR